MTPVNEIRARSRASRHRHGVIMRRPEADEKPPEEKSPEETRPEATAETEKEAETVDGTAKDSSVAPPESQSTPPKKKKGRFAAMLDEDAVEAEYETSIRGTPPPPSKPAASVEPTTKAILRRMVTKTIRISSSSTTTITAHRTTRRACGGWRAKGRSCARSGPWTRAPS